MTGLLPHSHGMVDVTHAVEPYRAELKPNLPFWSRTLQQVGYHTAYLGKWHIERTNRLAAWAEAAAGAGARAALEQRLFRAYFTDNLDVADHGVLAGLAAEVNLDPVAASEALATGAGADQVRAEEARATELGISAVPTFVIEGLWAIPGAQDVDTFVQVLHRAAERLASTRGNG